MKKKYRLLKNEDFQKLIKGRNKLISKSFILYYDDNELNHIRIGISVSSKYGEVVEKNRAKRQVSAMVSKMIEITTAKDLVIIVRNEFKKKTFNDNANELEIMIKRIEKEKS